MFGLNKITLTIIGILSLFLVVTFTALVIVSKSRDEVIKEKGQLEIALQTQKAATDSAINTIDKWKQSADDLQKALETTAKVQIEATKEARKLNDLFSQHNLELLAKAKPGLVGNRINAGSNNMLRLLENAANRNGSVGIGSTGSEAKTAEDPTAEIK